MLQKLNGAGLPNVYLLNGFDKQGAGETETIAYHAIDLLYIALARAICLRTSPLQSAEVRFLRRRLGISQEQIGAMCGKSSQAVAKWEKGQAVPIADGNLIRLAWLSRFSKKDLAPAVQRMATDSGDADGGDYVMTFTDGRWAEDRQHAVRAAYALAVGAMNGIKQTAYNAPDLAQLSFDKGTLV